MTSNVAERTSILPRPKRIKLEGGYFLLSRAVSLIAGRNIKTAECLAEKISKATGLTIPLRQDGGHGICLQLTKRLVGVKDQQEGYIIKITPQAVTLTAMTEKGLNHAGQTLLDMLMADGPILKIPCGEIHDWPDFRYRGFMADPARAFIPLERLLAYVDLLAQNKYNRFHLHLSDGESFTFPTAAFPKLNRVRTPPHGVYARDELRRLCRYAAARGIEIIPEIELPGHATIILNQYPELKCRVSDDAPSNWTLCIGNENTYRFLDRLIGEVADLFPGNYIHIGTDEIEFVDDISRTYASWHACSACQRRMRHEKLKSSRHLFYYFLKHMQAIAAGHGKRLMMWNDNIDIAAPHAVPRDILQQFWRVAAVGRGPYHGCSMQAFLRDGFQVVNSFYPETYLDGYINDAKLVKWNPLSMPAVPAKYRAKVLGGECCAWSDGGKDAYAKSLPSGLALFADRLWNKAPVEDPDRFAGMLARHIFGPRTPQGLNRLFPVLGMMAFPVKYCDATLKPAVLKSLPRRQRLTLCLELRRIIRQARGKNGLLNSFAIEEYDKLLTWLQRALSSDLSAT